MVATESLITARPTEIRTLAAWTDVVSAPTLAALFGAGGDGWATPVHTASTQGRGADNPTDPLALTDVQKARSIMLRVDGASAFRVRLAINRCCTTGRNFLIAGCAAPTRARGHAHDALTSPQCVRSVCAPCTHTAHAPRRVVCA